MRKVSILWALLLITSLSTFAQSKGKSRTGFIAGVNYSRQYQGVSGTTDFSDFKTGLLIGLVRDIPVGGAFVFQPGVQFNRMGGKTAEGTSKYSYLSIPTLFKLNVSKKLGFVAGPQTSLLLSAKGVDNFNGETDLKDATKSLDLAALVGLDYSYGKNQSGMFGVRYQAAMNNIQKISGAGNFLRNSGFHVYFGYRFK